MGRKCDNFHVELDHTNSCCGQIQSLVLTSLPKEIDNQTNLELS